MCPFLGLITVASDGVFQVASHSGVGHCGSAVGTLSMTPGIRSPHWTDKKKQVI